MQDMTETVLLFLLKADLQVLSIFVVFSIEIWSRVLVDDDGFCFRREIAMHSY